jgi:hypothetical protein
LAAVQGRIDFDASWSKLPIFVLDSLISVNHAAWLFHKNIGVAGLTLEQ